MKIHNLLEEIVLEKIDDVISYQKQKHKNINNLKLDIACYVLNRIEPVYVVSGRGLAYLNADYLEKLQRDVDIVTLIHSGIERVTSVSRPYYEEQKAPKKRPEGCFFNFPIIKGNILNSKNFEPIYNIEINLQHNAKLMKMIEPGWPNPYKIVKNTAGTFIFWPYPHKALKAGIKKTYELEITVITPEYELFHHYFNVDIEAEDRFIDFFRVNNIRQLENLYLVPV